MGGKPGIIRKGENLVSKGLKRGHFERLDEKRGRRKEAEERKGRDVRLGQPRLPDDVALIETEKKDRGRKRTSWKT